MKYLILLILLTSQIFAQTTQWNLTWDANPDSDNVKYYDVYRANYPINDATPEVWFKAVQHPDTFYIDNDITKGVLYYYRLKAVNQTDLESNFSEEVFAAIPEVLPIPSQTVYSGTWFQSISKADYLNYPDDDNVTWIVTGGDNILATVTDNSIVLSYSTNWIGTETLTFKAANEIGFNDIITVPFTVRSVSIEPVSNVKFELID